MTKQLITPNPNIKCYPGWCLMYVRQAFGLNGLYPSATAGWNAAKYKHQDRSFPAGGWVPVWFHLAKEPLGHVALMAPDGSVFSTSDPSNTAHHHPNLDHLLSYYRALGPTYLGWSEDIEGVAVVGGSNINLSSSTTTSEGDLDMSGAEVVKGYVQDLAYNGWKDDQGNWHPGFMLVIEESQRRLDGVTKLLLPGEEGERLAGPIPQMIAELQGGQKAILYALGNLGRGEPVDVEAMKAAAKEGAAEALAGLEAIATTTVTLSQEG
ncbi:hypothetical protein [Paenarthrobacter sp. A20]|uniref:hypothetical protein n=1 Tax=Paenarthrobacter sp. A20 TaxID=2817891 RepID=UPI0020A21A0D|nr:hypothetical protein [Paenarthrobacter sp. A20]MCP1414419.1 hypothetical protein [Paenarthrobacter sp. A20]